MTIRILNAEPEGYSLRARSALEQFATVDDGPLAREELLHRLRDYDGLIVRFAHRIDREAIAAGRPRLKAIGSPTTGLDHIDVAAAEELGVKVVSLRGDGEFLRTIPATAEHTWALLLALVRRIPWAAASVMRGEWDRDGHRGRDLAGKTLGIVGLGRVGSRVALYGRAFGMRVVAYDPAEKSFPPEVERASALKALLRESDVVTIHVPLTEATLGLIGAEEFASMRDGAFLVNTSRGAVIDEKALLEALERGHLAGAALDVLDDEPELLAGGRSALVERARDQRDVVITPHVGGATLESMEKTEIRIAEKLRTVLVG